MPLDADGYKILILTEVGDTSDGLLAGSIATLWTKHDDAASLELQYLYAKRSAIDVLLGRARKGVDYQVPNRSRVNLDQLFQHLIAMREDVDTLIELALASGVDGTAGAGNIGHLTTTAPRMPPPGARTDANDSAYRGDPYRVSRRRP